MFVNDERLVTVLCERSFVVISPQRVNIPQYSSVLQIILAIYIPLFWFNLDNV